MLRDVLKCSRTRCLSTMFEWSSEVYDIGNVVGDNENTPIHQRRLALTTRLSEELTLTQ
jgi:hypothetical protein